MEQNPQPITQHVDFKYISCVLKHGTKPEQAEQNTEQENM